MTSVTVAILLALVLSCLAAPEGREKRHYDGGLGGYGGGGGGGGGFGGLGGPGSHGGGQFGALPLGAAQSYSKSSASASSGSVGGSFG